MGAKYVFFDFDGTLADSLSLALIFGDEVAAEFGLVRISVEEFRKYSMREGLKRMGLPIYRLPEFALRVKKYMRTHIDSVNLFEGTTEFLNALKEKGLHLVVLSSNSQENIELVLRKNNILELFDEIVSDSSILGKHSVIRRAMKRMELTKEQVVYVGDEVRDIEACKKVGVSINAVTWGFDGEERLSRVGYGQMARNFKELTALLLATH